MYFFTRELEKIRGRLTQSMRKKGGSLNMRSHMRMGIPIILVEKERVGETMRGEGDKEGVKEVMKGDIEGIKLMKDEDT